MFFFSLLHTVHSNFGKRCFKHQMSIVRSDAVQPRYLKQGESVATCQPREALRPRMRYRCEEVIRIVASRVKVNGPKVRKQLQSSGEIRVATERKASALPNSATDSRSRKKPTPLAWGRESSFLSLEHTWG